MPGMSRPEDLAERIERLVLRHEELKRTNTLLAQQLDSVSAERDSLRSRLAAARARIDALLDRLPADAPGAPRAVAPALLPPPPSTPPPDTDAA
jgi:cell division protein ZapB